MKIAILTTIDASMTWFMLPMAYGLKSRGIDVTLICNMSDEFYDKYSVDFQCVKLDIERGFNLGKTIMNYFYLVKIFKKEKFDMIEYATDNVGLPAAIAGKHANIKIRLFDAWGILFVAYDGIKKLAAKIIEKTEIKYSTDIRQVSEKNLEFGMKSGLYKKNSRVKVLGKGGTIGVDLNRFDVKYKKIWNEEIREKYHIPQNAMLLGFVGRIQRDKGINELIEAYRKLYEEDSNIYLMLVGFIDTANPIKDDNMSWAKNCPNIIFTGRVANTEKYMSAFDMLVHPTYREGFGMVLQEAGAVKTPIITTNIIGPSEFITDGWNGVLVDSMNTESLYKGIKRNMNNLDKMSAMAEECYLFTKQYFDRIIMVERMINDRLSLLERI